MQIGIIGCGQMGQGIAHVCALNQHSVLLFDNNLDQLEGCFRNLEIGFSKLVSKEKITYEQAKSCLGNVSIASCLKDFSNSELIIEVVKEDYEIKEKLLKEISEIAKDSIIATNTSALSVERLSKNVFDSSKFLGIHFMNPVYIMPLVEIITHDNLSCDTLNEAVNFCESIKKQIVKCKDSPGFIVNRLLIPMINQAILAFESGLATKEDIDKAMQLGANFPMGPLALADFIGLDTCLAILNVINDIDSSITVKPASILKKMVLAGNLGKKSGQGFYEYKNK